MRYVLYDKSSGVIVHTHQSFGLGESEPRPATEDEIRAVIARFPYADRLSLTRTEVPLVSSRQAAMSVDLKTGEILVKSLVPDEISRRLAELHRRSEED
jgi:hypothetical protein